MKTVSAFQTSVDAAYLAGFDCGTNGADKSNCHLRYFATEQLKAAWENGKSVADMQRLLHAQSKEIRNAD